MASFRSLARWHWACKKNYKRCYFLIFKQPFLLKDRPVRSSEFQNWNNFYGAVYGVSEMLQNRVTPDCGILKCPKREMFRGGGPDLLMPQSMVLNQRQCDRISSLNGRNQGLVMSPKTLNSEPTCKQCDLLKNMDPSPTPPPPLFSDLRK